jgi:AraC-like DNA-binding protein
MVEHATLTRVEAFDGTVSVDLLRAAYVTHRFAPHAHDELAVGVVESGHVRTRIGQETCVVAEQQIVVLNPGDVHTGEAVDRDGYRYRMLYVDLRAACGVIGQRSMHFAHQRIDDPLLALKLARAHATLETGTDPLASETLFADALGALAGYASEGRLPVADDAEGDVVRVVRDYLESEYARVVTLAELASLTGLSPFYVSRRFREAVGLPPYAYLALVRVRRARAMIDRGQPISAVTHATGFSDQSHLTKQFKRVVGVPPGQYAREVAGRGRGRSANRFADRAG